MRCSRRVASSRAAAALALALAAGLGACRASPREAEAGRDLLGAPDEVEVRSDSLDLPFLVARPALEARDWRTPEASAKGPILWNGQPSASLALPLASSRTSELRVRLRRHPGASAQMTVDVIFNGRSLGQVTPRVADTEFRFQVPGSAILPGASRITFAAASRRTKGRLFALSGLEMAPVGSPANFVAPRLESGGAVLPAGASLGFYLEAQPGAELAADLEARGPDTGRARLLLETDAGPTELADTAVPPRLEAVRVRTPASDGQYTRLLLMNAGTVPLLLRRLRFETKEPAPPAPGVTLEPRPNVVVYLTDTLRADHLGAYGHPRATSPRFDAFAREAILFEQAWAQSGWTKPAVASIFTGLTPGYHRVGEFRAALPLGIRTLAGAFSDAGFRTAGFSDNPILSARSHFDQGFAMWQDTTGREGASAARLVSRAFEWLGTDRRPFLLYIHAFEPHYGYQPGETHWRPFRPTGGRTYRMADALGAALRDPDAMRWLKSAYEGEIHKGDAAFGALLDGLRERGLLDSTVVVFVADHGDEFGDHGGLGHATTLYEEELHVPLAIRLPGARRGGVRDAQPIQQADLFPTLLRLTGLPAEPDLEGRDLSARLANGVADTETPEMMSEMRLGTPSKAALRVGALKLIQNDDVGRDPRATRELELYDLAADAGETRNLESERPVTAAYLRHRLEALKRLHARRVVAAGGAGLPVSREERDLLRSLGYVQ